MLVHEQDDLLLILFFADPEFYPHNVAVWPISPSTLHIEWEYDEDEHRQALRHSGLEAVRFFINVSDGIADFNYSIPIQRKRYPHSAILTKI